MLIKKSCAILFWGIVLGGVFLSSSCEPPPPSLNASHRKHIDTLVKEQNALIRAEVDSICEAQFDTEVARMRDSIFELRYQEFKEKLGK